MSKQVCISKAAPTARHSARRRQVDAKLGPICSQVGAKLGPSCGQVGAKLGQVGSKNRLLEGLGAQEPPRPAQDPFKAENRSTWPLPPGAVLGAFWAMLASKSHQKAIQKAYKILIDVDVHFSSIWHRFWRRFGRLLAAMLASKMHYNLSSNFE